MSTADIAESPNVADAFAANASWERELAAWQAIPALSPIWDDVDGFVEALWHVAESKRLEREAGRVALTAAINELQANYGQELEYFEAKPHAWQATSIPHAEAAEVADSVAALGGQMHSLRALHAQPKSNYAQMRRLREETNAQEDAIVAQIATLAGLFGDRSLADDPPVSHAVVAKRPPEEPSRDTEPTTTYAFGETRVLDPSDLPTSNGTGESHYAAAHGPEGDAPTDATETLPEGRPVHLPLSGLTVPPPVVMSAHSRPVGDLHRRLAGEPGTYSPFTGVQERTVVSPNAGVGVIFASSAMGFELVPEAISQAVAAEHGDQGAFGVIPHALSTGQDLYVWLADFASDHPGAKTLIACQPIAKSSGELSSRILGALHFCDEWRDIPLRLFFCLGPEAALEWFTMSTDKRRKLDGRIEAALSLQSWTGEAIQDRLLREGKDCDLDASMLTLEATGGWTWSLDKLFELCGDEVDPRGAIQKLTEGLYLGGALRDELLMRIGVRPDTVAEGILNLLLTEGEVLLRFLTPDKLGMHASRDECSASIEMLKALNCVTVFKERARLHPFLARVLSGT